MSWWRVPLPAVALTLLLAGCMGERPVPLGGLDRQLEQAGTGRAPSLSGRWLAWIASRSGRDQVLLVDVEQRRPLPLPGLNRADALPLSVAVDSSGERLAVVRQIGDRTELVLHRRSLATTQRIAMQPSGVPRRVALRADGRELAVEVSRNGTWQVDLVRIP